MLTGMLKKAFVLRDEEQEMQSRPWHGHPAAELWKVGRSDDARLFRKRIRNDAMDFVVDVLIDASGSQRSRQSPRWPCRAYIISEALSNLEIPLPRHELLYLLGLYDPAPFPEI